MADDNELNADSGFAGPIQETIKAIAENSSKEVLDEVEWDEKQVEKWIN